MFPFSNVRPGNLVELEEVLWEWTVTQQRSFRVWEREDAPWWYGERASISVLAGAIWRSGGIALEEYSVEKAKSAIGSHKDIKSGRNDLYFHVGGADFILEAKSYWPNLRSNDMYTGLENALQKAANDVKKVKQNYGARRMAAVFIGPQIPAEHANKANDRIHVLLDALNEVDGAARAWVFPEGTDNLVSGRGLYYPGAAIVIQEV